MCFGFSGSCCSVATHWMLLKLVCWYIVLYAFIRWLISQIKETYYLWMLGALHTGGVRVLTKTHSPFVPAVRPNAKRNAIKQSNDARQNKIHIELRAAERFYICIACVCVCALMADENWTAARSNSFHFFVYCVFNCTHPFLLFS